MRWRFSFSVFGASRALERPRRQFWWVIFGGKRDRRQVLWDRRGTWSSPDANPVGFSSCLFYPSSGESLFVWRSSGRVGHPSPRRVYMMWEEKMHLPRIHHFSTTNSTSQAEERRTHESADAASPFLITLSAADPDRDSHVQPLTFEAPIPAATPNLQPCH